jgi:hypothetical protein
MKCNAIHYVCAYDFQLSFQYRAMNVDSVYDRRKRIITL